MSPCREAKGEGAVLALMKEDPFMTEEQDPAGVYTRPLFSLT